MIFQGNYLVMSPRRQTTPRKCAVIVRLYVDGCSEREIAAKMKLSKSTVHDCIQRYKSSGSGESKPRRGRPRITDKRHDMRMRRLLVANPTMSSSDLKHALDSCASTRTIRRRLVNDFNLRSRRPARKPLLTPVQAKKRLAFCRKYLSWTVDQWNKVLFSDESTFCQFGSIFSHVRRLPNTRYDPKNVAPTVKHCPKIMVWGCFGGSGRGSLVFVPVGQMVNAGFYLNMLKDRLLRTMHILRCDTFQQDSAPCHVASVVKNWMKNERIQLLDWPGNSPDLNPIENLWQIMKRKVRIHAPKSMLDLQYWIKWVWVNEVTPTVCQKLANSMPTRIQNVIRCKGYMTKY